MHTFNNLMLQLKVLAKYKQLKLHFEFETTLSDDEVDVFCGLSGNFETYNVETCFHVHTKFIYSKGIVFEVHLIALYTSPRQKKHYINKASDRL